MTSIDDFKVKFKSFDEAKKLNDSIYNKLNNVISNRLDNVINNKLNNVINKPLDNIIDQSSKKLNDKAIEIKKYTGPVERPPSKDYEQGFISNDIEKKYPDYKCGSIDSYLALLSKKTNDNFTWFIASDAQHINIYDKDNKLYKTKRIVHINGDSYYTLFNEPATDKIKAHKAITYINWFI